MLVLSDIQKKYGKKEVLKGINLKVGNGLIGFLGANGVGKSTLFKIMNGTIEDFSGNITFPKLDKEKNQCMIGYLPQTFKGYSEMCVYEFLDYIGHIKGDESDDFIKNDIAEKIKIFNLEKQVEKKIKSLSGGQLGRVGLAQAFLLNPKIVLLDEPTVGLDPKERIRFKNFINQSKKDQMIFLSTHIVSDLESIADIILILKDGYFVEKGREEEILKRLNGSVYEIEYNDYNNLDGECIFIKEIEKLGSRYVRVVSNDLLNSKYDRVEPTLDDLYLYYFEER